MNGDERGQGVLKQAGLSRREFFSHELPEFLKLLVDLISRVDPTPEEQFFDSPARSYALTHAYPYELLLETAKAMGIDAEGKERVELMKEIIKKSGGSGGRK